MTDLTEQWKDGTLKAGAYYILSATGGIFPDSYNPYGYFEQFDSLVKEVLAPVPSYKEWQAKLEENTQLKELLKECREFFYENLIDTEFHFSCGLGSNIKKQSCIRSLSNLKTKINQALGEDK